MAVRVAYGERDNIKDAISQGKIPNDTIIITKGNNDSELFFYDAENNLVLVSEKNRFESLSEAQLWVNKYPCAGHILSIHNGSTWLPYIVNDSNILEPIKYSTIDLPNITRIDGGTSYK